MTNQVKKQSLLKQRSLRAAVEFGKGYPVTKGIGFAAQELARSCRLCGQFPKKRAPEC